MRRRTIRLIAFITAALLWSDLATAGPLEDIESGIKASRQGRHVEAIRLLGRAIASKRLARANLAVAHANRCLALTLTGRPGRAVPDCTQAILLQPRLVEAHINRGMAWRRRCYRASGAALPSALFRCPVPVAGRPPQGRHGVARTSIGDPRQRRLRPRRRTL
jgi:hypothetical protein